MCELKLSVMVQDMSEITSASTVSFPPPVSVRPLGIRAQKPAMACLLPFGHAAVGIPTVPPPSFARYFTRKRVPTPASHLQLHGTFSRLITPRPAGSGGPVHARGRSRKCDLRSDLSAPVLAALTPVGGAGGARGGGRT